jgi:hypothetical protein
MRKHIRRWVLAASALAFLAPASAAVAGDEVPIKGNLTIVNGSMPGQRLITGNVSHLGAVTGVAWQQVFVVKGVLMFFDTFTLTAANGDMLFGTGTGTLTVSPTTPPGFLAVNETIMITNGTGRFAGATGSATGMGLADITTHVAQESFTGTISSPGSLK